MSIQYESRISLTETMILGRSEGCDIRFRIPTISKKHCTLVMMATDDGMNTYINLVDGYRDERSTNGVYVNGVRVNEVCTLHHQDRITFAQGLIFPEIEFLVKGYDSISNDSTLIQNV